MRSSRWPVLGLALLAAMAVAGTAFGVGPWPGLARTVRAPSGDVLFSAAVADGATTVTATSAGKVIASATLDGAYGIPAVTSTGLAGGLSPDGRLLVLAEPPLDQRLRERSRFLVLSTGSLSRVATIELQGEFGFDAISPNRRTLYLIQHVSSRDLVRYVVRAYDLRTRSLLSGAIVDKRAPDEAMRGYPVARATSAGGAWVYTLYTEGPSGRQVFVHALNAAGRSAFCIDILSWPGTADVWRAGLRLAPGGGRLLVRAGGVTVARIDTKTLRVA